MCVVCQFRGGNTRSERLRGRPVCKIIKYRELPKYHLRSFLKKPSIRAAHSSASTPAVT